MKRLVLLMTGFMVGTAAFALDFNIGAGLDFSDANTTVTITPSGQDDQTANRVVTTTGAPRMTASCGAIRTTRSPAITAT